MIHPASARLSNYGPVSTVRLDGELDIATLSSALKILETGVDQNRGGMVLIDLADVRFVDASGLTTLVRAQHYAVKRNTRIFLVNVPQTVRRTLDYTGMGGGLPSRVYLA